MSEQTYQLQVFVPSRTPVDGIDRLVDTLETVANKLADLPYPYEVAVVKELEELESALAQVTLEAKLFTRIGDEHGVLSSTIEKSVKLGVQALKIAHILSEYQIQENTEDE